MFTNNPKDLIFYSEIVALFFQFWSVFDIYSLVPSCQVETLILTRENDWENFVATSGMVGIGLRYLKV